MSAPWKLRFAPHLGTRSTEHPYFDATVGNPDPAAHIAYLHTLGFAGIVDNWIKSRPVETQWRMAAELRRCGMKMGCFVYSIREVLSRLSWGSGDTATAALIREDLRSSIETARRMGGSCVVITGGPRCAGIGQREQLANMTAHLKSIASEAADAGLVICVEAVCSARSPGNFLHSIIDAAEVVQAVDRASVRLVFDVAHVEMEHGEVQQHLCRYLPLTAAIQLSDVPGRLEPGSGQVDFVGLLRLVASQDYPGLVELEHGMQASGAEGERLALQRLMAINAAL